MAQPKASDPLGEDLRSQEEGGAEGRPNEAQKRCSFPS
jgi:hypothetical protein